MRSAAKKRAAQRRAALDLVKKLNAAADATNRFLLLACLDAGEPGRGLDDGRVILIRNMTEYATYLDSVYNKEGSA